jgi:hypothetical protein
MIILFGGLDHARKIARAAGCGFDSDVDFVLSLANPQLLGGVIYTNYTGRSVQMHMAGFAPAWPTPRFMWTIYDFPFNRLKVERVIGTVPSTNLRALKIDYKMGFEHVATIPRVVPGGNMEVFSMTRDQCRYLRLGWRYVAMENAA